jgi:hypothetical protein
MRQEEEVILKDGKERRMAFVGMLEDSLKFPQGERGDARL